MTNEALQSKNIDFLKFPLIVGIVFIHMYSPVVTINGVDLGTNSDLPLYFTLTNLFSEILARIAVPLFFFMSGFLFFITPGGREKSILKKYEAG